MGQHQEILLMQVEVCKENVYNGACSSVTEKHHFALCIGD